MLVLNYFLESLFFSVIALVLAVHEVEVEGGDGWAENLSTVRISTGATLLGNKPLTGYHVTLVFLIILFLHLPFIYGRSWSLAAELLLISKIFFLAVFWDFLWFVYNPEYGVNNFSREKIPWYDERWIFDLFPITYLICLATSAFLFISSYILTGKESIITNITILIGSFVLTTATSIAVSPYYRNFRRSRELQKDS